jgi:hypothetical protein
MPLGYAMSLHTVLIGALSRVPVHAGRFLRRHF